MSKWNCTCHCTLTVWPEVLVISSLLPVPHLKCLNILRSQIRFFLVTSHLWLLVNLWSSNKFSILRCFQAIHCWLIKLILEINHRFSHSTLCTAVLHSIFISSALTEGQHRFSDVADDHNIILEANFFGTPEHGHVLVRTAVTATYNLALEKTKGNGCYHRHPLTAHVNLSLKMLIFLQDHELNYSIQVFFLKAMFQNMPPALKSPSNRISCFPFWISSLCIPPYLIYLN